MPDNVRVFYGSYRSTRIGIRMATFVIAIPAATPFTNSPLPAQGHKLVRAGRNAAPIFLSQASGGHS
jgi:hypothetical protein